MSKLAARGFKLPNMAVWKIGLRYSLTLDVLAAAWLLLWPETWHSLYLKSVLRITCKTEFDWTKNLLGGTMSNITLAFSSEFHW